MDEPIRPAQAVKDLPKRALAAVTGSTVLYLGLTVLIVVLGVIVLAWNGKAVPESVIALAGVALGFLGRVIGDEGGNG